MNFLLYAALFVALTNTASADDGGIIGIQVNDISMNQLNYNPKTGQNNKTSVAKPNYEINIIGAEASKLMQILPAELFVNATDSFPEFKKIYNANVRGLVISGKDQQPSLVIGCLGGDVDSLQMTDPHSPKFTPYRDGAHCTITVLPTAQNEDVYFTFDPTKDVCR